MNTIKSKFLRLFISLSFLLQSAGVDFAFGDTAQASQWSSKLSEFPSHLGVILEQYAGKKGPFVLYIQDAHCVASAQGKTAQILEWFYKQKIKSGQNLWVAAEGAAGPVFTSFLGAFPDPQGRKEITQSLMEEGLMSGPESLAIQHPEYPIKIFGLENSQSYIKNFKSFRDAISWWKENEQRESDLKRILEKIKKQIYSQDLLKWTQHALDFKRGEEGFLKTAVFLEAEKISVKDPEVQTALKIVQSSNQMNETAVQDELLKLSKLLQNQMDSDSLKKFVELNLLFRLGKMEALSYYETLFNWMRRYGISKNAFPNLRRLLAIQTQMGEVDWEVIQEKVQKILEENVLRYLSQEKEKILWHFECFLGLAEQALQLKLSREEWEEFDAVVKDQDMMSLGKSVTAWINISKDEKEEFEDILKDLKDTFHQTHTFYQDAYDRDGPLIKNFEKLIQDEKPKFIVLVTGGFHRAPITQRLKDLGVSYCVVSPKISGPIKQDVYWARMMDERLDTSHYAIPFASVLNGLMDLVSHRGAEALREVVMGHFIQWLRAQGQDVKAVIGRWPRPNLLDPSMSECMQILTRLADLPPGQLPAKGLDADKVRELAKTGEPIVSLLEAYLTRTGETKLLEVLRAIIGNINNIGDAWDTVVDVALSEQARENTHNMVEVTLSGDGRSLAQSIFPVQRKPTRGAYAHAISRGMETVQPSIEGREIRFSNEESRRLIRLLNDPRFKGKFHLGIRKGEDLIYESEERGGKAYTHAGATLAKGIFSNKRRRIYIGENFLKWLLMNNMRLLEDILIHDLRHLDEPGYVHVSDRDYPALLVRVENAVGQMRALKIRRLASHPAFRFDAELLKKRFLECVTGVGRLNSLGDADLDVRLKALQTDLARGANFDISAGPSGLGFERSVWIALRDNVERQGNLYRFFAVNDGRSGIHMEINLWSGEDLSDRTLLYMLVNALSDRGKELLMTRHEIEADHSSATARLVETVLNRLNDAHRSLPSTETTTPDIQNIGDAVDERVDSNIKGRIDIGPEKIVQVLFESGQITQRSFPRVKKGPAGTPGKGGFRLRAITPEYPPISPWQEIQFTPEEAQKLGDILGPFSGRFTLGVLKGEDVVYEAETEIEKAYIHGGASTAGGLFATKQRRIWMGENFLKWLLNHDPTLLREIFLHELRHLDEPSYRHEQDKDYPAFLAYVEEALLRMRLGRRLSVLMRKIAEIHSLNDQNHDQILKRVQGVLNQEINLSLSFGEGGFRRFPNNDFTQLTAEGYGNLYALGKKGTEERLILFFSFLHPEEISDRTLIFLLIRLLLNQAPVFLTNREAVEKDTKSFLGSFTEAILRNVADEVPLPWMSPQWHKPADMTAVPAASESPAVTRDGDDEDDDTGETSSDSSRDPDDSTPSITAKWLQEHGSWWGDPIRLGLFFFAIPIHELAHILIARLLGLNVEWKGFGNWEKIKQHHQFRTLPALAKAMVLFSLFLRDLKSFWSEVHIDYKGASTWRRVAVLLGASMANLILGLGAVLIFFWGGFSAFSGLCILLLGISNLMLFAVDISLSLKLGRGDLAKAVELLAAEMEIEKVGPMLRKQIPRVRSQLPKEGPSSVGTVALTMKNDEWFSKNLGSTFHFAHQRILGYQAQGMEERLQDPFRRIQEWLGHDQRLLCAVLSEYSPVGVLRQDSEDENLFYFVVGRDHLPYFFYEGYYDQRSKRHRHVVSSLDLVRGLIAQLNQQLSLGLSQDDIERMAKAIDQEAVLQSIKTADNVSDLLNQAVYSSPHDIGIPVPEALDAISSFLKGPDEVTVGERRISLGDFKYRLALALKVNFRRSDQSPREGASPYDFEVIVNDEIETAGITSENILEILLTQALVEQNVGTKDMAPLVAQFLPPSPQIKPYISPAHVIDKQVLYERVERLPENIRPIFKEALNRVAALPEMEGNGIHLQPELVEFLSILEFLTTEDGNMEEIRTRYRFRAQDFGHGMVHAVLRQSSDGSPGANLADRRQLLEKILSEYAEALKKAEAQVQRIYGSAPNARVQAARQKLDETAQRYVDFLSQGDDFLEKRPDVFLVLGNPDLRTFLEFAKQWKEIERTKNVQVPIVLAGGRGRGTIPLIQAVIAHYEGTLTDEEQGWLARALSDESIHETDILSFFFMKEGIPQVVLHHETSPSRVTADNFKNSLSVIASLTQGKEKSDIAVVTSPPLLLRSYATARKVFGEGIGKEWNIRRFKAYTLNMQELSDDQVVERTGYLAGYPEVYTSRHPQLNQNNEMKGTQPENNPYVERVVLAAQDWELLESVQLAFAEFLDAAQAIYDSGLNRMITPRATGLFLTGESLVEELAAQRVTYWGDPFSNPHLKKFFDDDMDLPLLQAIDGWLESVGLAKDTNILRKFSALRKKFVSHDVAPFDINQILWRALSLNPQSLSLLYQALDTRGQAQSFRMLFKQLIFVAGYQLRQLADLDVPADFLLLVLEPFASAGGDAASMNEFITDLAQKRPQVLAAIISFPPEQARRELGLSPEALAVVQRAA